MNSCAANNNLKCQIVGPLSSMIDDLAVTYRGIHPYLYSTINNNLLSSIDDLAVTYRRIHPYLYSTINNNLLSSIQTNSTYQLESFTDILIIPAFIG